MPVKGSPDNLYIGRRLATGADLPAQLSKLIEAKFDFVAIPLAAPREGSLSAGASAEDFIPSVDSDLILSTKVWNSSVVGIVTDTAEPDYDEGSCGSSPSGASTLVEAENRRANLEAELRWSAHLGVANALLPPPRHSSCASYARTINELILGNAFASTHLCVRIPMIDKRSGADGWKAWNRLRSLCEHHARLYVALELTSELPSTDRELDRWLGEPVKFVVVPTSVFLSNKSGHPVLPKRLKALVAGLFRRQVQVIISGADGATEVDTAGHVLYIARLFQSQPTLTGVEAFAQSHLDTLQAPLQPLADNLDAPTYELFETDPVKYVQYEEAVFKCLQDKVASGKIAPFIVMVVGAGRGPLVAASLRAAKRAAVQIKVWAVEKNHNAVHTLRHRKRSEESWSCVEIIASDMRTWQTDVRADIMVSELLGSWGDNELSPECLDGAQRFLAADGVSIPQSYVSSLTPVSTTKLWNDIRDYGDIEHFETSYVVYFHQASFPTGAIKDCFTFRHPNWSLASNDRYVDLTFEAECDTLVHGFAGYFDCDLYKGVRMSIHPETYSDGMFSWFPIFFPLRTPIALKKGETIRSHWWRRHDASKVWYEWAVSEPIDMPIQNPGGRSHWMSTVA